MARRTTVNISLTPELDAFLQDCVSSGRYQTTSEVVREALRLLQKREREDEEAFQHLKQRLERGAAKALSGETRDGAEVFAELRQLLVKRRPAAARSESAESVRQP